MPALHGFLWNRFNKVKRFFTILFALGSIGTLVSVSLWMYYSFPVSYEPPFDWSVEWVTKFLLFISLQSLLAGSYFLMRLYQVYMQDEGPWLKFRDFVLSWDLRLKHEQLEKLIREDTKASLAHQNVKRRYQRSVGAAKRALDEELNRLLDLFPQDSSQWKRIANALADEVDIDTKYAVIEEVTPQIPVVDTEQQHREEKIAELCERLQRMTPEAFKADAARICQRAQQLMKRDFKEARGLLVKAISKRRELNKKTPEFLELNEI